MTLQHYIKITLLRRSAIKLKDSSSISPIQTTRKITSQGYLKATATVTKVGVQKYLKSELTNNPSDNNIIVKVFRSPDSVFNEQTYDSLKLSAITFNHPDIDVDVNNIDKYGVGVVGESIAIKDEDTLSVNIQVHNKSVIDEILNNNAYEVTLGYDAINIKEEKGVYKNENYDYVMNSPMIINHCAIVKNGRCGASVKILDKENKDIKNMSDKETIKEHIKDIYEEAKNDVKNDIKKAEELVVETAEKIVGKVSEKVTEVDEKLKAEDAKLKEEASAKVALKDHAIKFQDSVNERVRLIDTAKQIIPDINYQDMSNREIIEASAKTFLKDSAITRKSDDYLLGYMEAKKQDISNSKMHYTKLNDALSTNNNHTEQKVYSAIELLD